MTDSTRPGTADAEARIREIREDIQSGENALDPEPINSFLADDVALYGPGVTFEGQIAVAEHHRNLYAAASSIDVEFTIEEISVVGPVAVERGGYTYTAAAEGADPSEGAGAYLYVYEQGESGAWEIHRIVWD
jgi:uncharacterized protein (TIGR02246 family)